MPWVGIRAKFHAVALGALGAAVGLVILGAARAADQDKGYVPGLGDMMNASMQVHHTKLWYAGNAENWALAAYEVQETREAMEHIEAFEANWHDLPVGEMVKSLAPDLDRLDQAIKAKDPAKFHSAYGQLTESCNACHAGTGYAEIKIIAPISREGGAFTDQDFTTAKGVE